MMISSNNWLVTFQPNPTAPLRLLCFTHAGGSATLFRTWGMSLAPMVEIVALQLPGHGHRMSEEPYVDLTALVEAILLGIGDVLDEKPFAFFGHSMGAILAFELARALRVQSLPQPAALFVASRRAPHLLSRNRPIHTLSDEEFFIAIDRRYNGIPLQIRNEPEILRLFTTVLRADLRVVETYHYQSSEPLAYPVKGFVGMDDNDTSPSELQEWAMHTSSTFDLTVLPGGHFFLRDQSAPLLNRLADTIATLKFAIRSKPS